MAVDDDADRIVRLAKYSGAFCCEKPSMGHSGPGFAETIDLLTEVAVFKM